MFKNRKVMLKLMIDSEMDEYRVAKLTTVADNMKNSPHILTKKFFNQKARKMGLYIL